MPADFLVEETAVRDSGESRPFDCGVTPHHDLVLTLGITHALEQESIEVEILGSEDGLSWQAQPLLAFPPKYYCGTYEMTLPGRLARFLKVKWHVQRWSRSDNQPFFRFYVFGQFRESQKQFAGAA